eukprot:11511559-Karenia_brevis.AAC.1
MAQASLFAMRDKLEGPAKLELQVTDPNTNAAVLSKSTAMPSLELVGSIPQYAIEGKLVEMGHNIM